MKTELEIKTAVVFPSMKKSEIAFLQNIREKNDLKGYTTIGPHFTIFSPTEKFTKHEFTTFFRKNLRGQKKISFNIHTAIFMPPLVNHKSWYVFLVPDKGFSGLCKLNRLAYQNNLRSELDENFPFIPHITVGSSNDKINSIQLVNKINELGIRLSGEISRVSLVEIVNNEAKIFDEIQFQ